MSEFLERNKKRGLLGGLRERVLLAALAGSVAIVAAFVFIAPSNFIGGAAGSWREAASWSRLLAVFGAAKRGQRLSWHALFGRSTAVAGPSSVELVRGDAAEFGLVAAAGRGPKTIHGILTPEEAQRAGAGVMLAKEDLAGISVEDMGPARPAAYAGRGFFSGKQGAVAFAGEEVRGAFDASEVPSAGAGRTRGVSPGRVSRARVARMTERVRADLDIGRLAGAARSVTDLTQAQEQARVSRAPLCTAARGCAGEEAAANSGAVYDGRAAAAAAPESGAAPDLARVAASAAFAGAAGSPNDEAQRVQQELQACRQADADYAAQEDSLAASLQQRLAAYRVLGCTNFWSFPGNRKLCSARAREVAASCRLYNAAVCAHVQACPLSETQDCARTDCDSLLAQISLRTLFARLF